MKFFLFQDESHTTGRPYGAMKGGNLISIKLHFTSIFFPVFPLLIIALSMSPSAATAQDAPGRPLQRNPVLEYPDRSIKDFAAASHGGVIHIFFSSFHESRGRIRCHVMKTTTRDFTLFTPVELLDDGADDGWIGMASPDISEKGGIYYLTYNSWGDKPGEPNRLFYRTSKDLNNWSERKPLAYNLTQGRRAIDAAMISHEGRFILMWKDELHRARIASANNPDGDFKYIGNGLPVFTMMNGEKNGLSHENYQFFKVEGKLFLLATGYPPHEPYIYESGSGSVPRNLLEWKNGRKVEIPDQGFNAHDRANAAGLLDLSGSDGFYYLLYAGNSSLEGYLGRGWNRMGVARTADLAIWHFPVAGND